MPIPVSQIAAVVKYLLEQKLRRQQRYPLVLMLEPLYRCNLSCSGCGKIQYPPHILRRQLSVEQCIRAVEECPAPVVSIAGGEPLLHPEIDRIVASLVAMKKYVYLCSNGLLLARRLESFSPSRFLNFSVHLDGLETEHDLSVCLKGAYRRASLGIRLALERGFRVTTNTTLFAGARPERIRRFFDEMMRLGVEGMTLSPGYSYAEAPDRDRFLVRARTQALFREILAGASRRGWRFNQSPLFLEFLTGARDYECTPWGNPSYGVFGWQRPCYLLQEGYAKSFRDLLENTAWERYGRASGNPRCRNCMVHSGFEATAVNQAFSSLQGFCDMIRATLFGPNPASGIADTRDAVESAFRTAAEPAAPTQGLELGTGPGALVASVEYRGDVILTLDDGSFARGFVSNLGAGQLELWEPQAAAPRSIEVARIRGIEVGDRSAPGRQANRSRRGRPTRTPRPSRASHS